MLIGIDMLAVQASGAGTHEAGRYGRQLVERILARPSADEFILYTHEDWPLARVAESKLRVTRRSLPALGSTGPSRLRPTIQRLVDGNPDGLDWMVLLDPFTPEYGGIPPESPLGGLKLAAIVHDLGLLRGDDRALTPLRRYEAIFAVAGHTAAQCRSRLGSASSRVATLNVAADPAFAAPDRAEPLSSAAGTDLGRLGINGPFSFHSASKATAPANLRTLADIYARLPIELRHRHRLVIAGDIRVGADLRRDMAQRGIEDGLILVGEVGDATLRTLYGRCSAYLSPLVEEGAGLALVEAMTAGAPVIAGRTGTQAEIVGDAGLLVDPLDPAEVAAELAELLKNADLEQDLRHRSVARAATFGWESAVDAVLDVLTNGQTPAATSTPSPLITSARHRIDAPHLVRPRIAYFPCLKPDDADQLDLVGQIPPAWLDRYNVDFYLESDHAPLADGLPVAFGGFDVRLFDRNDSLLGYHAVVHRVGDAQQLTTTSLRLAARPGLVLLEDDTFLDAIQPESGAAGAGRPGALRSDFALAQVRDLIRTGSSVVVRSPRHFDILHAALGDPAEAITLVPLDAISTSPNSAGRRAASRARLDLWAKTVVVGQFAGPEQPLNTLLSPRALKAILQTTPNVVFLGLGWDRVPGSARLAAEATELGLSNRYLFAPAVDADQAGDVVALLDLAVHPGGTAGGLAIASLLRAGVPTLALGGDLPTQAILPPIQPASQRSLARTLRNLIRDEALRANLGQLGRDYALGFADPVAAAGLLAELIERCAHDLPRAVGLRTRREGLLPSRRVSGSPHFSRPASATTEAAHSRGER